jgi:hypothetical protein
MRYFIIPLVVYPFDVMVSIDESDKVLLTRLLTNGNKAEDCMLLMNLSKTTQGRTVILPSNQTVIRFRTQAKKVDMINNIVHEAFHATTFVLERVGMTMDLNTSDEAYAYLLAYLTKEICKKLKF